MTVLVVHSTESDPGSAAAVRRHLLAQGTVSHEVYDPSNGDREILVHWPLPSKSLRNLAGGVQTNNRGRVWQVEVVGRAASIPNYPDAWHYNLARYLIDRARDIGCPIEFPKPFLAFPASYGATSVRMSGPEWLRATGIIGHMHVPENTHGDPGDISRTIAHIQRIIAPPSITEDPDTMIEDRIIKAFLDGGRDPKLIGRDEVWGWRVEAIRTGRLDDVCAFITWTEASKKR